MSRQDLLHEALLVRLSNTSVSTDFTNCRYRWFGLWWWDAEWWGAVCYFWGVAGFLLSSVTSIIWDCAYINPTLHVRTSEHGHLCIISNLSRYTHPNAQCAEDLQSTLLPYSAPKARRSSASGCQRTARSQVFPTVVQLSAAVVDSIPEHRGWRVLPPGRSSVLCGDNTPLAASR